MDKVAFVTHRCGPAIAETFADEFLNRADASATASPFCIHKAGTAAFILASHYCYKNLPRMFQTAYWKLLTLQHSGFASLFPVVRKKA
jgi:hypothetical protein